jgi:hypothetical protein
MSLRLNFHSTNGGETGRRGRRGGCVCEQKTGEKREEENICEEMERIRKGENGK